MENIGYMDFHSHILPGIDDGSRNMEMTCEMIRRAYEQGVRTIVATPHSYPNGKHPEAAKVLELTEQVRNTVCEKYPDLTIIPGNEILYRESIVRELEEGKVLSINQGRYVLVEFYPGERYKRIFYGLKELVENGYLPVVAHVERVDALFHDWDRIKELVKLGCYMQSNCEAYMGGFFDRRSRDMMKLMEKGWIHFLGSDTHDLKERAPIMEDCVKKLKKKITPERLEKVLYTNPKKCLENKFI